MADDVVLTTEERRILAALEKATGQQTLHRRLSLTVATFTTLLRSSRKRRAAMVLLFLAGLALMVATFTHWPAVAVVGVAMQACALWWGLTHLPSHGRAWRALRTRRSMSAHPTTPPQ